MAFYATEDNVKLYYEVQGTGQPIVFIHGVTVSHLTWTPAIKTLRNKYMCVSYDHRGHGMSDCPTYGFTLRQLAKDLHDLIDYLQLKDVVLAGHSMGGGVVFEYIAQYGLENISKVAILDMSPKIATDEEWTAGLFENYPLEEYFNDMDRLAQNMPDFLWYFMRHLLPEIDTLPEAMKDLVAPGFVGVNHPYPVMSLMNSMFTTDNRDVVSKITVPLLYILPEHPAYPESTAKFVCENTAGESKCVFFEGCTHMSLTEQPEKTAQVIADFVG